MLNGPRVRKVQQFLADNQFLPKSEIDGWMGDQTAEAVIAFFEKEVFLTKEQKEELDKYTTGAVRKDISENGVTIDNNFVVIREVEHISQGDKSIADITIADYLVEDKAGNKRRVIENCQKIGCLSCCCAIVGSYLTGVNLRVDLFIEDMHRVSGYTNKGILNWIKAAEVFDLKFKGNLTHIDALGLIDDNNPVILRVSRRGHFHFVVAVGYHDEKEQFYVHDPETWRGNAYEKNSPEHTIIPFDSVNRIDALVRLGT